VGREFTSFGKDQVSTEAVSKEPNCTSWESSFSLVGIFIVAVCIPTGLRAWRSAVVNSAASAGELPLVGLAEVSGLGRLTVGRCLSGTLGRILAYCPSLEVAASAFSRHWREGETIIAGQKQLDDQAHTNSIRSLNSLILAMADEVLEMGARYLRCHA
jgi:hypothetical protein